MAEESYKAPILMALGFLVAGLLYYFFIYKYTPTPKQSTTVLPPSYTSPALPPASPALPPASSASSALPPASPALPPASSASPALPALPPASPASPALPPALPPASPALPPASPPSLTLPSKIFLVGGRAGRYCADDIGKVNCNRDIRSAWETFTVESIDEAAKKIALRGGRDNKYCADDESGINCNRNVRSTWETFTWEDLGNDQIALIGGRSGKYCADDDGRINCNRGYRYGWETFIWEDALKASLTNISGRYVEIHQPHPSWLNLAEIEIISTSGSNVAKGADIQMTNQYLNFGSMNLIDGNMDTIIHTTNKPSNIRLDLKGLIGIKQINLYNRKDSSYRRSNGTILKILDENEKVIYTSNPLTDPDNNKLPIEGNASNYKIFKFYPPNPRWIGVL